MCRKRAARREWEMERKLEQSLRHGGESGLPLISEGEGATAVQLLHSPDIHKHPAAVRRTIYNLKKYGSLTYPINQGFGSALI
jgi:hypothetical protein